MKKKRNPSDLTTRNAKSYHKRLTRLESVVKRLLWESEDHRYLIEDLYAELKESQGAKRK